MVSTQVNSDVAINPDVNKVEKLKAKHVTYVYFSFACPSFVDTYNLYGFKMKCGGCVVSQRKSKRNEKAIKKIDSVYGAGWFEKNRSNFIARKSE